MFHLFLFLSFQIILRPGSTMPKTVTVADYLGSKHNPTDCNDTIMYVQIIVQILTNYFSNPFLSDTSKSSTLIIRDASMSKVARNCCSYCDYQECGRYLPLYLKRRSTSNSSLK